MTEIIIKHKIEGQTVIDVIECFGYDRRSQSVTSMTTIICHVNDMSNCSSFSSSFSVFFHVHDTLNCHWCDRYHGDYNIWYLSHPWHSFFFKFQSLIQLFFIIPLFFLKKNIICHRNDRNHNPISVTEMTEIIIQSHSQLPHSHKECRNKTNSHETWNCHRCERMSWIWQKL